MCEAAAGALNLVDVSVSFTNAVPRPEGCYFFQEQILAFALNKANTGNGATQGREPICMLPGPPPTAAPAPTPTLEPAPGTLFQKIQAGTCAELGLRPIRGALTCEAAAAALNLPDKTASISRGVPRPEGCYFFQAQFLFLATNKANVGGGAVGPREPICASFPVPYHRISSGSCASNGLEPISDAATCEDAAAELGLADRTAFPVFSSARPEGCYFKGTLPGFSLFLAVSPLNAGNGAAGGREPICKDPVPKTASVEATSAGPGPLPEGTSTSPSAPSEGAGASSGPPLEATESSSAWAAGAPALPLTAALALAVLA